MNKKLKQTVMALTVTGLLVGGGVVGAQTGGAASGAQSSSVSEDAPNTNRTFANRGQRGQRGFGEFGSGLRGLFLERLALGTTVEVTLYDGNPEENGNLLETLNFTYGEDSEAAFAEQLAEARQNAQYIQVEVGEQTRALNLSQVEDFVEGRGLLPRELAFRRGLEDGDTVTATFFDGDPEAGGSEQQALTFTYGQDSAAGFADSFTDAAQDASFVTVTASPQSYTVDLSARAERGPRDFGGRSR